MDNEYEPPRQRKKPKVKESVIDHTYRDYSQVEVSSDEEGAAGAADDKKQSRLQPNFPAKLHAIVSNPNYDHIISWQVRNHPIVSHATSQLLLHSSFALTNDHRLHLCCISILAPRKKLEDCGKILNDLVLLYARNLLRHLTPCLYLASFAG